MLYNFKENQSNRIIEHFGVKFYKKVLRDIETYSKKWKLEILQFVEYFSVNCIFTCRSEQYGDVVLKIGNPSIEVFKEYNTLCEYNGRHFCNVLILI